MSFSRVWETALIYAISFHIGLTIEKITGVIVITKSDRPLRLFGSRIFFTRCKRKTKYTEIRRISCSIFLSWRKWDLRGWQIYDLIQRCPLQKQEQEKIPFFEYFSHLNNPIDIVLFDKWTNFYLPVLFPIHWSIDVRQVILCKTKKLVYEIWEKKSIKLGRNK
jgi:hypothetical protein